MSRSSRFRLVLLLVPLVLGTAVSGARAGGDTGSSSATYFNDASTPGADPYVLHDAESGYYYAYSTTGADRGFRFGIYRSPDLATWERVPGGALDMSDGSQWGRDWFWAPEVYHNARTGKFFLFYSARRSDGVEENFGHADFEEPSTLGVAVSDSPVGPFRNITDQPIDYHPYDPEYHDVNQIMGPDQKKPPATLAEGRTAPLGTYVPMIDPNVVFDDGRIYLYFSRNAYRNWVWDRALGKYVEESNINAVELTPDWWNDPDGRTMPAIHPRYQDTNRNPQQPSRVREDGFEPILDYGSDPQSWENAHVHDYERSGGRDKDRRWAEGSTVVKARDEEGRPLYYLTYSANNYQNASYGVGYAVADHPLGPWRKSPANPVLAQDEQQRMLSTGHGDVVSSPDGAQLYYVHHGRPAADSERRLYTERMRLDPRHRSLDIGQSTSDQPVPSGVAPYTLDPQVPLVELDRGRGGLDVRVLAASGAAMDLAHPANRLTAELWPPDSGTAVVRGGHVEITGGGVAALTLRYQRRHADGTYADVRQNGHVLSETVPVVACDRTVTGHHNGPLTVSGGVTCLRAATVSGPVAVEPGASLVSVDSVVRGAVRASGAESVFLSGGEVSGRVDLDGVAGTARVQGTSVGSALSISGSPRDAVVDRVAVAGSVLLRGGGGAAPFVLSRSRVGGAVRDFGGTAAIDEGGSPNVALGKRDNGGVAG